MMYADNLLPRLEELARRAAEAEGVEVAWIEFKKQKSSWFFRVFIDSEPGVGLDDCQRVTERLSVLLDVEDPIESSYTLEVSTPGLDRPLFRPGDYERFRGRLAVVNTNQSIEGQRRFMGRLAGVEGEQVILRSVAGDRVWRIPLEFIDKGRLEPEIGSSARGPSKARKRS